MGVLYVSGEKPTVIVGRDPGCDLVLGGSFVSRRHLYFRRVTDDAALVEVTGTNGAVVDRLRVKRGYRGYVRSGDSVVIGNQRIVWFGAAPPGKEKFIPFGTKLPEPDTTPVEIEGPPPRRVPEKPSIMLAAGPALTMAIPILLGAGRSVAILSSVFAAVWAVVNVLGRVRKQKTEELRRRNTYMSYLSGCENMIRDRLAGIIKDLNEMYPEVSGCLKGGGVPFIPGSGRKLSEGHIRVRIGKGAIPSPLEIIIPKERFEGIDDSLKELPAKLKEKYVTVPSSPYLVSIQKGSVSIFVLNKPKDPETLSAFILQIAVLHSPEDIKIQVKTNINTMRYYKWITLLPHFEKYPGSSPGQEAETVFITDETRSAWEKASAGAYAVLLCEKEEKVPGEAFPVLNRGVKNIRYDTVPGKLCYSFASQIAGIREDNGENSSVPLTVPFGKLFDAAAGDDIERQLREKVRKAYAENDITSGILAPIGISSGGRKTVLDIHERASGPHGLIAGTTGSGKSELLTTMILSFALRYPPDKLAFFLIDYKGGGMSGLFADLWHLVGSISNLSKAVSKRAMISLRSENIRRQRIFAECKVNNINDYTKLYDAGKASEPLPHILIVIDEFAELKKEEPEFMDCLISVSQIGRSLGMHLILATQKPSGVVDDRIRSNSAFRIALRLLDRSDSTDILGRPDAASINECGRAYLQSGNDEALEFFQSGYAMGPVEGYEKDIRIYRDLLCDEEITCDDHPSDEYEHERRTWYEIAMSAAISASSEHMPRRPAKLWLPELPEVITDDRAYAWFDNPYDRVYEKAVYDPNRNKNMLIIGRSGSGKSEIVRTVLWKMDCEREVYIIDRPGGAIKDAANHPFCGGYVTYDDKEDMLRLLLFIEGRVNTLRRAGPDKRENLPVTVLVVEDQGEIKRMQDPEIWEVLERILRNASAVGVYVVSTYTQPPESRIAALYDTTLCLGDCDTYTAASLLKVSARDIPDIGDSPGRGIGLSHDRPLEFQAVLTDPKVQAPYPVRVSAAHFPHVPNKPGLDDLLERIRSEGYTADDLMLPIGFEYRTGKVYSVPLDRTGCVLICGRPYSGRHTLLFNISVIASVLGIGCIRADDHETLLAVCEERNDLCIITVENLEALLEKFYSSGFRKEEEDKLAALLGNRMRYARDERFHPVIIGILNNRVESIVGGGKIFGSMTEHPYGVTLGGCLDQNRILDYSYMSFSQMQMSLPRHNATILKYDENCFSGRVILPETVNVDNSQIQ